MVLANVYLEMKLKTAVTIALGIGALAAVSMRRRSPSAARPKRLEWLRRKFGEFGVLSSAVHKVQTTKEHVAELKQAEFPQERNGG